MRSGKTKRSISAILVLVLLLSALLPVTAYAADEQTSWDVEQDYEEALAPGQEDIWAGTEEELLEKPFDEALPMEEETPAAPPAPTKEEVLLTEIRDLLKEQSKERTTV